MKKWSELEPHAIAARAIDRILCIAMVVLMAMYVVHLTFSFWQYLWK